MSTASTALCAPPPSGAPLLVDPFAPASVCCASGSPPATLLLSEQYQMNGGSLSPPISPCTRPKDTPSGIDNDADEDARDTHEQHDQQDQRDARDPHDSNLGAGASAHAFPPLSPKTRPTLLTPPPTATAHTTVTVTSSTPRASSSTTTIETQSPERDEADRQEIELELEPAPPSLQPTLGSDQQQDPGARMGTVESEAGAVQGAVVPDSLPSGPTSPTLGPTTTRVGDGEEYRAAVTRSRSARATAGTVGISRTTRPPDLCLALSPSPSSSDVVFDNGPITPLALSSHSPCSPCSRGSPLSPLSPLSPRPVGINSPNLPPIGGVAPCPTPTSACTFGAYSPLTSTFVVGPPSSPPVARRGSEQYNYARRGSTGTFGGTRSRASVIQIPSTGAGTAATTVIDEVVSPSIVSEGSLTRSQTSQTSPLASPLGRTPPAGHWHPESPTAIMQYLLDARQRSELAILPSEPPAPEAAPTPAPTPAPSSAPTPTQPSGRTTFFGSPKLLKKALAMAPPSSGTRLMPHLQEEHGNDPAAHNQNQNPNGHHLDLTGAGYWNNRHTDIFDLDEDQVHMVTHLGERRQSEAERLLDDLCDRDDCRPKLSTEIVVADVSSELASAASHRQSLSLSMDIYRSTSIESARSGSSGYPESATTTAGLLPPSTTTTSAAKNATSATSATSVPSPNGLSGGPGFILQPPPPPRLPAVLASKADLPAEQKAVLVKRTRKLERVLGEPLPENTVERFVVEPTMGATTTVTMIEDAVWPRPPSEFVPEWLREDCVPQRASRPASLANAEVTTSRSSRIARVLLGDPAPPVPTDLRVYVSRERHVAESREGELKERQRVNRLTKVMPSPQPSHKASLTSLPSIGTPSPEDVSRHTRRTQLTKLQRLLGDPITPAILASPNTSDESLPSARLPLPFMPALTRTLSNSSSVLTERTRERWTSRFRRHHHSRADSPSPAPSPIGAGASGFAAAAAASATEDTLSSEALTADQRRLARKRATKLGKLFGDQPPPCLYMPTPTSESSGHDDGMNSVPASASAVGTATGIGSRHTSGSGSPVFESYRHSLNSLIYLFDHDQERLAMIVDELHSSADRELSPTTPAPSSPVSTYSHTWGLSRRASLPPMSRSFSPPGDSASLHHPLLSPAPTSPREPWIALPASPPDPNSHGMRRRRTSKLAHFFGERSADFSDFSRPNSAMFDADRSASSGGHGSDEGSSTPSAGYHSGYPSGVSACFSGYSGHSGSSGYSSRPISIMLPPRPVVEPIVHDGSPDNTEPQFHPLPPPPPPRRRSPANVSIPASIVTTTATSPAKADASQSAMPALSMTPSPPAESSAALVPSPTVPDTPKRRSSISWRTTGTKMSTTTAATTTTTSTNTSPVPHVASTPTPTAVQKPTAPARRPSSICIVPANFGVPSESPTQPQPQHVRTTSLALAAARRDTLDGVLSELWEDVQSEMGRRSVDAGEAARLGDMMGVLRHKRDSVSWAQV